MVRRRMNESEDSPTQRVKGVFVIVVLGRASPGRMCVSHHVTLGLGLPPSRRLVYLSSTWSYVTAGG